MKYIYLKDYQDYKKGFSFEMKEPNLLTLKLVAEKIIEKVGEKKVDPVEEKNKPTEKIKKTK